MNSHLTALLVFFAICISLYFLFRVDKGLVWIIRRSVKQDNRVIIEDILKMLYHAEDNNRLMSVNNLLERLKSDEKHLLELINKMELEGLISFSDNHVGLSNTGRDYALRIIRAHRLWEKYLSEETGYHKLEWHNRAEQMEHHLSEEQTDLLALKLGNPRYDPHGDPIPSKSGEISIVHGQPLSSFPIGTIGRVTHIEDEPEVIYKQILAEDLHIGSIIKVIESNDRRIKFDAVGEEYILAPIVAANITIAELKKEDLSENNVTRLSSLKEGETARVMGISRECKGENRRRLLDLGIVMGTKISIDITSPMNDPKGYLIRDTVIAFRNDQASNILIEKE